MMMPLHCARPHHIRWPSDRPVRLRAGSYGSGFGRNGAFNAGVQNPDDYLGRAGS